MRKIFLSCFAFGVLLFMSCTGVNHSIPEKYNLDTQLIRVKTISDMPVGTGNSMASSLAVASLQKNRYRYRDTNDKDQETKEVSDSSSYQLMSIDEQSLILRGGPDKNYLLILEWPIIKLESKTDIKIVTEGVNISENTDLVVIGGMISSPIKRIYLIGDDNQAAVIKDQLQGKPKKFFPQKNIRQI